MQIGPYTLASPLILAPMAGVTDLPFRKLCMQHGAGMAVSEMLSANPTLLGTRKSRLRSRHDDEQQPRAVQILGADPEQMAAAARRNVEQGAQIIDINMGCPAKKVCRIAAGSALLRDEQLVSRILTAVVNAVTVPVTLKIRTGWDPENRNAVRIARIAEASGIQALAVHGRTRACGFSGQAEYSTIREVKAEVSIPVIANGDIDSPEKAREVLAATAADGLMIGRGALGTPWIFRTINTALSDNRTQPAYSPDRRVLYTLMLAHINDVHCFYGPDQGVRLARKHIGWYARHLDNLDTDTLQQVYEQTTPVLQLKMIDRMFEIH